MSQTQITQLKKEQPMPLLLRFVESEAAVKSKPIIASPERGGESNPKEEAPPKEPTGKGPWGD